MLFLPPSRLIESKLIDSVLKLSSWNEWAWMENTACFTTALKKITKTDKWTLTFILFYCVHIDNELSHREREVTATDSWTKLTSPYYSSDPSPSSFVRQYTVTTDQGSLITMEVSVVVLS